MIRVGAKLCKNFYFDLLHFLGETFLTLKNIKHILKIIEIIEIYFKNQVNVTQHLVDSNN